MATLPAAAPPPPFRHLAVVPADSIAVGVVLPSQLWSCLLAEALNATAGLAARVGPNEVLAGSGVLVVAVPTQRAGWERLGHWCRRGERVKVLVIGEERTALAAQAVRKGAAGYLDWEAPLATMVQAIRGVHAGELWADRKIAWTVLRSGAAAAVALTPAEQRVLGVLAEGKRNKEIAALLDISETTVKSHLNRVYHKLHLSDRLQAALYVERHGVE